MKTLFEKIIDGDLPGEKVYEDDQIVAIKDKYPQAPLHLLIIPRKRIPDLQSVDPKDLSLIGEIVRVAQILANQFGVDEEGYRLLVNVGPHAGQTIDHLHFHLLGGRPLGALG